MLLKFNYKITTLHGKIQMKRLQIDQAVCPAMGVFLPMNYSQFNASNFCVSLKEEKDLDVKNECAEIS